MPSSAGYQRQYGFALDALRMLAQRDMLSWWGRSVELSYTDQRAMLEAPFVAIAQTYGEQAAYVAADYLFQQRSLDESLAGLEYPEVASPVAFEQAKSSYRYAMWLKEYSEDLIDREIAKRKLLGVLQRLVTEPARKTVENGVSRAGTAYARLPEPGACDFCLMMASRGEVYSLETVIGDVKRYHDNCRCLGIEVSKGSPLPTINQQLQSAWKTATKGKSDQEKAWKEYLGERRELARRGPLWPPLKTVTVPRYRGDGMATAFPGEELPDLDKMPGHVLFGWRDRPRSSQGWVRHSEDSRMGHTYDSQRESASKFPENWSNQEIVDAVRDAIERPDYVFVKPNSPSRTVYREIKGELIMAKYAVDFSGVPRNGTLEAYPVKTLRKGARRVGRQGTL
ncbi:hypothetical protein ACN4DR_09800 [Corynebacterium macclintockiae]